MFFPNKNDLEINVSLCEEDQIYARSVLSKGRAGALERLG
jgi:hypothetical protein